MSLRFDSPLISGALVFGNTGLGISGATIRAQTATGTNGPGILYSGLSPADDSSEIRAFITSASGAGRLVVNENGSFVITGASNGSVTAFAVRVDVDGVSVGTATNTVTFGNGATLGITTDPVVYAGSAVLGTARSAAMQVTTGPAVFSGSAGPLGSSTLQISTSPAIYSGSATSNVVQVQADVGELFTNNAISLLIAPISASDTELTVMTGYGSLFPNPAVGEFFLITLENQAGTLREIIRVTSRIGDRLLFPIENRGQEGTVALSWPSASGNDTIVDHRITAGSMNRTSKNTPAFLIAAGATGLGRGIKYSSAMRGFKLLTTITNQTSFATRTFETVVAISGLPGAETVAFSTNASVGSITGTFSLALDTGTQTVYPQWENGEANTVALRVRLV